MLYNRNGKQITCLKFSDYNSRILEIYACSLAKLIARIDRSLYYLKEISFEYAKTNALYMFYIDK